MWLLGAETIFFPCFFLHPPPLSGHAPATDPAVAPTAIEYPLGATTFVLWGLTFGVVSELAVAGGGRAFAYQGPPYFRYVHVERVLMCLVGFAGIPPGGEVLLLCLKQAENPKQAHLFFAFP